MMRDLAKLAIFFVAVILVGLMLGWYGAKAYADTQLYESPRPSPGFEARLVSGSGGRVELRDGCPPQVAADFLRLFGVQLVSGPETYQWLRRQMERIDTLEGNPPLIRSSTGNELRANPISENFFDLNEHIRLYVRVDVREASADIGVIMKVPGLTCAEKWSGPVTIERN